MKNKILISLLIILSFLIGNFLPNIKLNFTKIRICNNSEIDIDSINLGTSLFFGEIKSGICTEYKKSESLYKLISAEINTIENEIKHLYITIPMDLMGVKKISFGKHTININELSKNKSSKIIKHYRGIGYSID